jgi:hypothetical protein
MAAAIHVDALDQAQVIQLLQRAVYRNQTKVRIKPDRPGEDFHRVEQVHAGRHRFNHGAAGAGELVTIFLQGSQPYF